MSEIRLTVVLKRWSHENDHFVNPFMSAGPGMTVFIWINSYQDPVISASTFIKVICDTGGDGR
jgi:hypothetical protein